MRCSLEDLHMRVVSHNWLLLKAISTKENNKNILQYLVTIELVYTQ